MTNELEPTNDGWLTQVLRKLRDYIREVTLIALGHCLGSLALMILHGRDLA